MSAASEHTPWYKGPTLLAHLEAQDVDEDRATAPFRMPVQWVNRPNLDFRGYAGTIAAGRVDVGDEIVVANSGRALQSGEPLCRRPLRRDGGRPATR